MKTLKGRRPLLGNKNEHAIISIHIFIRTKVQIYKYNYTFIEGDYEVPSCFYEFAYRHTMENGELFGGFVATSANKIFESTNLN